MTKPNLTAILQAVRAMIMRERVAYKDYLGEKTVTETVQIAHGDSGQNDMVLTVDDETFTDFAVGETYQVTMNGETSDLVAEDVTRIIYLLGG